MLIGHKHATVLDTCACVAWCVHVCIEIAKVAIHIAHHCNCLAYSMHIA